MKQRTYDSTIARMAGNIAAGFINQSILPPGKRQLNERIAQFIVQASVYMARQIVGEVERTEPGVE